MEPLACLNGQIVSVEDAKIPIWDRGFLFGDSVYEVLRIYQGRCWLETEHFDRLRRSLEEMVFPKVDVDALKQRTLRTIQESGIQEGTAYLHLTRGVAPRAHAFPEPPVPPTELIVIRPYDDSQAAKSRETGVSTISHPDQRWRRCDVKSTNLLANVIAHDAAHRAGCFEAVLVDEQGLVTEATHSSVLWIRDGWLEGTPEDHGTLPGTTRRFLIKAATDAGVPYRDARISLEALKGADEAILAGTTIEVLPIIRIDDTLISGGEPGPLSRRLQAIFRDALERWLSLQPA